MSKKGEAYFTGQSLKLNPEPIRLSTSPETSEATQVSTNQTIAALKQLLTDI